MKRCRLSYRNKAKLSVQNAHAERRKIETDTPWSMEMLEKSKELSNDPHLALGVCEGVGSNVARGVCAVSRCPVRLVVGQ